MVKKMVLKVEKSNSNAEIKSIFINDDGKSNQTRAKFKGIKKDFFQNKKILTQKIPYFATYIHHNKFGQLTFQPSSIYIAVQAKKAQLRKAASAGRVELWPAS
jgi:hypothetical protein